VYKAHQSTLIQSAVPHLLNAAQSGWPFLVGVLLITAAFMLKDGGINFDAAQYLNCAWNIVNGRGAVTSEVGSPYFCTWPLMTPALIALLTATLQVPVFFASKLMNFAAIALLLVLLKRWYGRSGHTAFALMFSQAGFLALFTYSWSEPIFLVFLIAALHWLELFDESARWKHWNLFLFFSVLCFLTRYVGYLLPPIGFLLALRALHRKNCLSVGTVLKLAASAFVAATVMAGYFAVNFVLSGTVAGPMRGIPIPEGPVALLGVLLGALVGKLNPVLFLEHAGDLTPIFGGISVLVALALLHRRYRVPLQVRDRGAVLLLSFASVYAFLLYLTRTFTYFDTFSFRILSAFFFVFWIGLSRSFAPSAQRVLCGAALVVLVLNGGFMAALVVKDAREGELFYQEVGAMRATLSQLDPDTVLIGHHRLITHSLWMRPEAIHVTYIFDRGIGDIARDLKNRGYSLDNAYILMDEVVEPYIYHPDFRDVARAHANEFVSLSKALSERCQ